jgi:large subunit ribosomal protein L22
MRTVATARFVRVSARKARLVLDQIRGRSVSEALATLQYTPRSEHNHQVRDLDALRVHHAVADGGPSLKRVQPRAMGRAFFIKHRTSHLTIGVSDETNGTRAVAPPRHMRRPPRTSEPRPATAPPERERPTGQGDTRARGRERKTPAAARRSGRRPRG